MKFWHLKCSRTQRLYNENFQEWKLIILRYINKASGIYFKFPSELIYTFPSFYQNIITSWCKFYSSATTLPSTFSSQYLQFNTFIKFENSNNVYYKEFSDNQRNYVFDFFNRNGKLKSWIKFVHECKMENGFS